MKPPLAPRGGATWKPSARATGATGVRCIASSHGAVTEPSRWPGKMRVHDGARSTPRRRSHDRSQCSESRRLRARATCDANVLVGKCPWFIKRVGRRPESPAWTAPDLDQRRAFASMHECATSWNLRHWPHSGSCSSERNTARMRCPTAPRMKRPRSASRTERRSATASSATSATN